MVGELIAGRYELHELVGSGGMSKVYRAHDRLLERTVAIKVLHDQFGVDDDYVERFRREARSVAQLAHPNIVTVIDRGEDEGRQYIVFEYVEGEDLKALVSGGALPVEDVLKLGLQIAQALAFAHTRGLVHRDVKPQNVLLSEEGEPKVTDFGIARSLDVQGVTQTGTVLGTSDYIAPEQARGEQVDEKTDMYSLGAVLYELLTGEVPYPGENFVAVAMRHVHDPPPSVLERRPDCPVRLDRAVRRAMAKDPAERFESMEELVDELETCLADLGLVDEGATMIVKRRRRLPKAVRPRRRIPVLPIGLVLLAVGATALGVLLWRDSPVGDVLPEVTPTQPVKLVGFGAIDPAGDGEHDQEAGRATDGSEDTYWTTEEYDPGGFDKLGVGLVLDAGRPVELSELAIISDDPGFTARIQGSQSSSTGFEDVSEPQVVDASRVTFDVDTKGELYQYYMIWLQLPRDQGGRAHINEVTAKT